VRPRLQGNGKLAAGWAGSRLVEFRRGGYG
jgi:hypothetical protein